MKNYKQSNSPSKPRFTEGLFGVSDKGVLYLPNGRAFLWLPMRLASKLQAWFNGNN
jgi:hypothetical protein